MVEPPEKYRERTPSFSADGTVKLGVLQRLCLTAHRDGQAHGLAVWFDATLTDTVTFSNAPDRQELVYGAAFFPWPDPRPTRKLPAS